MLTPFIFQADVMNGVDPAPQDVTLEQSLFSAIASSCSSTTARSPTR